MKLLGVDAGTTHCKAGLFAEDGTALRIASRDMHAQRAPAGYAFYDPEDLWQRVVSVIEEVVADTKPQEIAVVGIASMAETGLLIDRETGRPRSAFTPWFDTIAANPADLLSVVTNDGIEAELFQQTGIRPTFKCSLAKLLWLLEQDKHLVDGAVWLSVADYIAYRLTGSLATDYSLAGRTYAFRIDQKTWNKDLLELFDLPTALFPNPYAAGDPVGRVPSEFNSIGLAEGTPVAICGHDHLCAAFAVGAARPGRVFDSMGTAESLVGGMVERALDRQDFLSGLGFGCHVVEGLFYWMGGISASGGSIEWLRSLFAEEPVSYQKLDALMDEVNASPGELLYFPHLAGRGSPNNDPSARGAFIGLSASHRRADLLKAVLEGTAYEMEAIRQTAQRAIGLPIDPIIVAGGGTRNRRWIQIKADISGCRLVVPSIPEATLLGAALVAGVGCDLYSSVQEVLFPIEKSNSVEVYEPDEDRHAVYRCLYEQGYLPLQETLKQYYHRGGS